MEKKEREIVLKVLYNYKTEIVKEYEKETSIEDCNHLENIMEFLFEKIEQLEEEERKERAYDEKRLLTRLIAEAMTELSECYFDLEDMQGDNQVKKEELEQIKKEIDELERRTEKLIDEIRELSI